MKHAIDIKEVVEPFVGRRNYQSFSLAYRPSTLLTVDSTELLFLAA